ncbi:MAG: hypothetical protein ACLFWB_05885, partial [Armatimonadota bacterium]
MAKGYRWNTVLLISLVLLGSMGAHASGAVTLQTPAATVELRDSDPLLRITWADGQTLDLNLTVELGCHPLSRIAESKEMTASDESADTISAFYRIEEEYEANVRVEQYGPGGNGIRVQSLIQKVSGAPENVYYFWSWSLPEEIRRPLQWGDEVEEYLPPEGWGHGGFHDWYWMRYAQTGLGLVTPMYLLTSGDRYGNRCYLKPFPIERQLLLNGGPGLEEQFVLFSAEGPDEAADGWESLMSHEDLFSVPWERVQDDAAPAPEWLQETEIFQGLYRPWSEGTIETRVSQFPFVIGAPVDAHLVDLAQQSGTRTAIYVNFMGQYTFKPGQRRAYERALEFTDALQIDQHPELQKIDSDGQPVIHEGERRTTHAPCFLAPGYIEHCLEVLEPVLETEPDAIFIDNCFFRITACSGAELDKHEHRTDYPNDMAAYRGLIERVAEIAHSQGVAVLCNSEVDPGLWDVADGQMYECLWYPPGKGQMIRTKSWTHTRYAGEIWNEAAQKGNTVQPLHYLMVEPIERRVQATLLTYAWAQLYDLMWTDWYNLFDSPHEPSKEIAHKLYGLRLGEPMQDTLQTQSGCLWR